MLNAAMSPAASAKRRFGEGTRASDPLTDSFAKARLSVMALLAVSAAAERLGVSRRQVQHLVARGELRSLAKGVVDEASVDRFQAVRQGSHRRAWAGSTAWAAVALLTGGDAGWLGGSQRSRLRSRLRGLSAADLVERARERAEVTRYAAHARTGERLLEDLVHNSEAAGRLGLAVTSDVDGYLAVSEVADVVARHGLISNDEGRVTLRATTMDLDVIRELAQRGTLLAALDLAESLDVRERRAGLGALDRALDEFRD